MRTAPVSLLAALSALGAVLLATTGSKADSPSGCEAWEVEYELSAEVQLSDTLMGAGDGVHRIGPGKVVLRFDDHGGRPAGHAVMLSYEMQDGFTVESSALFWRTMVTNATRTTATPAACGVVAAGELSAQTLHWTSAIHGVRTDGMVTCAGLFCGKFGAPPEGTSEVHTAAHEVLFEPFLLGEELKTFSMAYSVVSKMESPRQTSRIALEGREVRRACVAVAPCNPGSAPQE